MWFWLSVLAGSILLLTILYILRGIFKVYYKGTEVKRDRKFRGQLRDAGMSKEGIDYTMEDLKRLRQGRPIQEEEEKD